MLKIISCDKNQMKGYRDSYLLVLENGEEFPILIDDYFLLHLYQLKEFDLIAARELSQKYFLAYSVKIALKYISVRSRSSFEVYTKLKSNRIEVVVIQKALEKLKELRYLDDYTFAVSFKNHLTETKKLSKKFVTAELKRKGIDQEIIEQILNSDNEKADSDFEVATDLIRKKFKGIEIKDEKSRQKAYRLLLSKGYSYDIIKRVLQFTDYE